jgi:hypothetical protein
LRATVDQDCSGTRSKAAKASTRLASACSIHRSGIDLDMAQLPLAVIIIERAITSKIIIAARARRDL